MSSQNLRELETKLTREQIEAARILSVNQFLPKAPKELLGEELSAAKDAQTVRLTYEEVAARAGVSAVTLYKWRHYDDNFIAYTNGLSTGAFMAHLPEVMQKHLEMTVKGQGSMKGIELFYKFGGLLVDRQEVKTESTDSNASLDERLARLKNRVKPTESSEE
jgi:hypothetical protein